MSAASRLFLVQLKADLASHVRSRCKKCCIWCCRMHHIDVRAIAAFSSSLRCCRCSSYRPSCHCPLLLPHHHPQQQPRAAAAAPGCLVGCRHRCCNRHPGWPCAAAPRQQLPPSDPSWIIQLLQLTGVAVAHPAVAATATAATLKMPRCAGPAAWRRGRLLPPCSAARCNPRQ